MRNRKKPRPSRTLRVERLENRSLLAAGIFDFAIEERTFDHRDRVASELDRKKPAQFERHDRGDFQNSQRDQLLGRVGHAGELGKRGQHQRHSHRHGHRDFEPPQTSSQTPAERSIESPASLNQQVLTLTPSPARFESLDQRNGSSALSSGANVIVIDTFFSQLTSSNELSIPDSLESPVSEPTLDAQRTLVARPSQEETPKNGAEIVQEREGAEDISAIRSDKPVTALATNSTHDTVTSTSPELVIGQFEASGGMVSLRPLLEWTPLNSNKTSVDEPWHLDEAVLPLIKQTIEISQDELAKVTDVVVKDWISDAGGMIAIDSVVLPLGELTSEHSFLDVQVESTVMLYRSADFFGIANLASIATPLPEALSAPMLDAIMTTLGGLADTDTTSADAFNDVRLSSIAYPVAFVTATGAVVSARKKSKRPHHLSVE